jgi:hypothetical protein
MAQTIVTRTGVLFVHGIGEPKQSGTVREFAAPMLSWLRDWHAAPGHDGSLVLVSSRLSYGGALGGAPAHVEVHLRSPRVADERQVVFAEGWWASNLSAPPPLLMIGWSLRSLWGVAVQLATAAVWRHRSVWKNVAGGGVKPHSIGQRLEATAGILIEYTSQFLLAIAYLLGAVAGYVVLIPLALLVQIPLEAVQQFILVKIMRPLLVDYLGDFEIYTDDEVQALNVRSAVERAADWLVTTGGCMSICVIAHSQGAAVAYDAIAAQASPGMRQVTKLITMGGSLNRAWRLGSQPQRLLRPLPPHVRHVDIWSSYDPVPGGPLKRPKAGPFTGPSGALSVEVTNGMNVLSDHGGYFHNREEVIARLVQEVDVPGDHRASRFCFADQDLRVRRRWRRVMTLVFWRLVALFLFALVALRRGPALLEDGRAAWRVIENVPTVTAIASAIGAGVDTIGAGLGALAHAIHGTFFLEGFAVVLSVVFTVGSLEPAFKSVLSLAIIAAIFGAVYLAITWLLYNPWLRADAKTAVSVKVEPRAVRTIAWGWARTVLVPAVIFIVAMQMR